MGQAADENTVRGAIHGPELDVSFHEKAVVVQRDLELLGQRIFFRGRDGGRQYQQIGPDLHLAADAGVDEGDTQRLSRLVDGQALLRIIP